MSGYSAEYGIPAGDREEMADLPAETPEPEVKFVARVIPSYELPFIVSDTPLAWDGIPEEKLAEFNKQDLLETIRHWANLYSNERRNDISADDHRLTHIWESASEIADRRGYCDVFDSIMEELGTGYTREMEYCVTVSETIKYDVHVTAPRNATQSDIEELIQYETLSDHTEIERDWEVDNYESAE